MTEAKGWLSVGRVGQKRSRQSVILGGKEGTADSPSCRAEEKERLSIYHLGQRRRKSCQSVTWDRSKVQG